MAHFAKIESEVVTQVIVAEQDFIDAQGGTWVQTSYNTRSGVHYQPNTDEISEDQSKALRKNYAGLGMVYDSTRDAFYAPQPYASWALNETTCLWEPPVAYPSDDKSYTWDEDTTRWIEVT
tara:strand:+ start:290 stop:652 length:363 start_codon:yes stop_codon:yes gene_type:complete